MGIRADDIWQAGDLLHDPLCMPSVQGTQMCEGGVCVRVQGEVGSVAVSRAPSHAPMQMTPGRLVIFFTIAFCREGLHSGFRSGVKSEVWCGIPRAGWSAQWGAGWDEGWSAGQDKGQGCKMGWGQWSSKAAPYFTFTHSHTLDSLITLPLPDL